MLEKPRLFGNLLTEVIRKDLCSFCGACMAACPISILWPDGEQPSLIGSCALCQVCYYACPNIEFPREDVELFLHKRTRTQDERVGIQRAAFVGRALRGDIRERGQDGGIVTALLAYGLENKRIEAAVVAGRSDRWLARPVVCTESSELIAHAGTKYTPSPSLLGVRSAIDEYQKRHVALVGTPCQIRAVRRIQTSPLANKKLAEAIEFTIGLFCMESYSYDKLIDSFLASKGIDISMITKTGIKKGAFIAWRGDEEAIHVPLKEIDEYVRKSCKQCDDFTCEYADISVGGVGCPTGYSTVLARTERGLELLKAAEKAGYVELRELQTSEKGYQKVVNMAQAKRARKAIQT